MPALRHDPDTLQPDGLTAFVAGRIVASGTAEVVARALQLDPPAEASLIVIDHRSGAPVDAPRPGTPCSTAIPAATAAPVADRRIPTERSAGAGRPRLGVVAREVTLLPRHWEWLAGQPGGASAALRRLVDAARRQSGDADRVRAARERAYRAMSALAGDRPGFEAATRALFSPASDAETVFADQIAAWPDDIRGWLLAAAAPVFTAPPDPA